MTNVKHNEHRFICTNISNCTVDNIISVWQPCEYGDETDDEEALREINVGGWKVTGTTF